MDQIIIIIDVKLQAELGDCSGTHLAGGFLAAPYLRGIGEVLISVFRSDDGISDLIAALSDTCRGKE